MLTASVASSSRVGVLSVSSVNPNMTLHLLSKIGNAPEPKNTLKIDGPLQALMSDDVEARQFDIGTTSIKLVRVGNVIQILFSSPLEAKFLYKELAEKYKRAEDRLKGV